jgi:hypothetical protein
VFVVLLIGLVAVCDANAQMFVMPPGDPPLCTTGVKMMTGAFVEKKEVVLITEYGATARGRPNTRGNLAFNARSIDRMFRLFTCWIVPESPKARVGTATAP